MSFVLPVGCVWNRFFLYFCILNKCIRAVWYFINESQLNKNIYGYSISFLFAER